MVVNGRSLFLFVVGLLAIGGFLPEIVLATSYVESHGLTGGGTLSVSAKNGVNITMTAPNYYIVNVTVHPSCAPVTTAYIYTRSGTLVETATVSGSVAVFSGKNILTTSDYYRVQVDNGGSNYNEWYYNTFGSTIVKDVLNFNYPNFYNDNGYNRIVCVATIGVSNDTALPPSVNVSITAVDNFTGAALSNLSVGMTNGSTTYNFTTINGTAIAPVLSNSSSLWAITISANDSGGYRAKTFSNVNVSGGSFAGSINRMYRLFNVTASDYVAYNGSNYSRSLTLSANVSCPGAGYTAYHLRVLFDGVEQIGNKTWLTCVGPGNPESEITPVSVTAPAEGSHNVSIRAYTAYLGNLNNATWQNQSFIFDLNDPQISNVSLNAGEGFVTPSANMSARCVDSVMYALTYNFTLNGLTAYNATLANGTLKSVPVTPINGQNNYTATCADLFGSVNASGAANITLAQLVLIDERTNTNFDVSNLTAVRAYFETASYMHDFKANGSAAVFFQSVNATKIRIELTYSSGTVINRYIDVDVISTPIRVCANKEGVTHYEQLIISAAPRPVVLKNVFSNCVVGADYTRFAYQDAQLLKAYSINSMYYLYTFDEGQQVMLASVDGSISSYVNLDVLEFAQKGYSIGVRSDALSFKKTANTTIQIYYKNLRGANTGLALNITRLDSGARVASTADFTNPNEFTFYFDYAMLNNVTNETLFKIALSKTTLTGTEQFNRYFTTTGQSGTIRAPVAFAVAFLLLVFGLTLTMARYTFGWFGIIVVMLSIGVLSFAVSAWYITLLMAIDAILLVYIAILLVQQNGATVIQ